MVIHVKFHQDVISNNGEIYISKNFSVLSHNFVSNKCNLIKLILIIYDYSVVFHMKFIENIISFIRDMTLCLR